MERALTRAWFDEQDRMTPEELLTVIFPMSRLGRRGYEEEAVRDFLSRVHAEFVRMMNDRTTLWQEVQRLRGRLITSNGKNGSNGHGSNANGNGALFGEADAHIHAVRILSTAQVTAERYVADAKAYSSRLTEDARVRREEVMQEAQQYADMLLEDAHAQAREAAVTSLNGSAPPQSERERQAAQAELAYLRTYSDVYRAHLRAYTEGILRGIDEWEHKQANSLAEAANGLPIGGSMPAIDSNAYMHHG